MTNIYHNQTYLHNNPTWHEEDAAFKANKIISLLNRNPIHFKTVCEIGCGSGEILVQLAAKFTEARFVGLDVSADAINIAKPKETSHITFAQINITEYPGVFDLLLVIDVIEHLDDYFTFLDQVCSRGRFTIFHIPLDISVWSLFREKMLIESKNRVGHIHNFTEDFIISILQDKGFSVIDKIYTEPTFGSLSLRQKAVNRVRKLLFRINNRFCTKIIGGYSILLFAENKACQQAQ